MAVQTHRKPAPTALRQYPELRVIGRRRRAAQLHLFTYVVGNALFWTLWAAISVTADRWYWWPVIPFVGWTLVLGLHLWHVYRHQLSNRAVVSRPSGPATLATGAESQASSQTKGGSHDYLGDT